MTKRIGVWVVAWLALASVPVFAQCLSAVQPVSVSGVFPNHEAELVAVAGSRLGMAKLDVSRITNQIWFGVYDANHQQIGSDTLVVPTSDAGPLALLWNGNEYALFYRTQVVPQLMMQRVDANGTLDGGPAYPVLTGDYTVGARWEPTTIAAGTSLQAPTPVFRKLDESVVEEELARLEEESGGGSPGEAAV